MKEEQMLEIGKIEARGTGFNNTTIALDNLKKVRKILQPKFISIFDDGKPTQVYLITLL